MTMPFRLTPLAVCLAALLAAELASATPTPHKAHFDTVQVREVKRTHKRPPAAPLSAAPRRFIVELSGAPLATYGGELAAYKATRRLQGASSKLEQRSAAAQRYRSYLKAQQNSFASALGKTQPGANVELRFDTTFNGVVVAGAGLTQAKLAALPGVKAVYPERWYVAQMDSSLALIKTPAVWKALGGRDSAGQGVRVAVIDSGIRPENPMFSDTGFTAPANLPSDDYCRTTEPSFCNNKLIVARWSKPGHPVWQDEFMSPLGLNGHGTHVAGTAVGNKVQTRLDGIEAELSGVAPGAYLMVYKALFASADDPAQAGGSDVQLMEALEYAVKDGADVINNSWGGGPGGEPAFSPYQKAFEAAEQAGVVIVTAAGNAGAGARSIGCPGCIEAGLTVGNTQHGRSFSNRLSLGDVKDLQLVEGGSAVRMASLPADLNLPLVAAATLDASARLGCNLASPDAEGRVNPFAVDAFKGAIALVERGSCSFDEKANNVRAAGAEALLVVNNQPGLMGMSLPSATLPALMMSQDDGAKVLAVLTDAPGQLATISRRKSVSIDAALVDQMAPSSSRGPNGDANFLKPDLSAPGTDILSAMSPVEPGGTGQPFALLTGTSMASPHVAGAAALLKAQHPDWDAFAIKAALTSTSVGGITKNDDGEGAVPATPFDTGAGRLDVERASQAALSFDKVSLVSTSCVKNCTFSPKLRSLASTEVEWQAQIRFNDPAIAARLSSKRLKLAPGAEAELTVTVDSTQTDASGWHFGQLSFSDVAGVQPTAVMPVVLRVNESQDAGLLSTTLSAGLDGEPLQAKTVVNNSEIVGPMTLSIKLPAGATLPSAAQPTVTDGTQSRFELDSKANVLTWQGQLATAKLGLEASRTLPEFVELKSNGGIRLECGDGCDESELTLDLRQILGTDAHITYNGHDYSVLKLSSNGYLAFGDESGASGRNQKLPDSQAANNVLAPFWADLDLLGTDDSEGGGELYANLVESGEATWLALEWNGARLYQDPSDNRYTFQIWMKIGSNEIYFNYLEMGAAPNSEQYGVTVGLEDRGGIVGYSHYYNGQGTMPASRSTLKVFDKVGGKLELDYALNPASIAGDTELLVDEDVGAALNLLDAVVDGGLIRAELATGSGTVQAIKRIGKAVDRSSLTLTDAASHGLALLGEDGFVSYQPNPDYVGEDRFSYGIKEQDGATPKTGTVRVTVAPVNDAPLLAAISGVNAAQGGASVVLKADASDPEGDKLRYRWTQNAGPALTLNGSDSAELSFVAPDEATTLEFQLVVNDGQLDSVALKHRVVVSKKDVTGGGTSPVDTPPVDTPPVVVIPSPVTPAPVTSTRAVAGKDRWAKAGEVVVLSGAGSVVDNTLTASYVWTQSSGPAVELAASGTTDSLFVPPASGGSFTFTLTVTDSAGGVSADSVIIHVQPSNPAPSGGGGAFTWLALALLGFGVRRAR